ncbi:MAG: cyclic nucleotide-binding domain-containing protein [Acidobacteriota bacterium]
MFFKKSRDEKLLEINALIARGHDAKAISRISELLKEEPESRHLRQLYADRLVRVGDIDRAVETLLGLADDLAERGFSAKAVALTKRIQRIKPEAQIDRVLERIVESGTFQAPPLASQPESEPEEPRSLAEVLEQDTGGLPTQRTSEYLLPDLWGTGESPSTVDRAARASIFNGLSVNALTALIANLHLLAKQPGAIIQTEGERANTLFVLTSGVARVYRCDENGRNRQLHLISDGDFFGEQSALERGARHALTVVAATTCELLELDRAAFEYIAAENPGVRELLLEAHEKRVAGIWD